MARLIARGLLILSLASCSSPIAPALDADHDPETGVKTGPSVTEWSYSESLLVSAPADLKGMGLPPCARHALPPNWVKSENAKPGDTTWIGLDTSMSPAVPLYLDSSSAVCGAGVGVHFAARAGTRVVVRAYRMGWYGGAGATIVWSSAAVPAPPVMQYRSAPSRSLASPGWPREVSLPIGSDWTPGVYLITTVVNGRLSGGAPLVVRAGIPAAALTMIHSSLTWAAYSRYDGTSLYRGPGGRSERAFETALARPTTGTGIAQFFINELPLIQFAERIGVPIDHITDLDLDTWPSLLVGYTGIVLPGHNEYFTRRMYDALTAARNSGTNIADLGANEIYWQARLSRNAAGDPVSMFVGRTLAQDPLAVSQPANATVQWAAAPLARDPTALIGQGYAAVQVRGSTAVLSMPPWLGTGTGLSIGSILEGIVANEADGAHASARGTPPNLQLLAAGIVARKGYRTEPVTTTYYSAPSGAGIFAAGITYWTCNLNDACPAGEGATSLARFEIRALTANLLMAFQAARFGASHPSKRFLPRSTEALRRMLPRVAIGQYGSGS